MQQVDARIGKRQRLHIGADARERTQPATMLLRRAQHRQGQIERDRLRLWIALAQGGRAAPGATADIDYASGFERSIVEAFLQALLHLILQHRMGVITCRDATESAAHMRGIENAAHAATAVSANATIASATVSAWLRNGA